MAQREKLTEKLVRAAEPRAGIYQVFDEDVRGFSLRIFSSGSRHFTLDYRVKGRQRRFTIGRWPEWTVTAAREQAKALRRIIDDGGDPLGEREAGMAAPRIPDLIDRYIDTHTPNLAPTNRADQISMLRKLVQPVWKHKLVEEITLDDVDRLLAQVAKGRARPSKAKPNNRARKLQGSKPTPIRANRAGEVLRKMFNLAVQWKMRPDNPATGFYRRIETERERYLSMDEIDRLATALGTAEDQRAANIIRMCMLTGARLGEVRCARFEQFNLEFATWSKPATTTKQRKIHRLPISPDVAAIVRQRQTAVHQDCPWLFPGDVPGQPVKEIRCFWRHIQTKADIAGVADAIPALPAEPITKPGDIWALGKHRLCCGDATDPAVVARLMQGDQATLMFTSPPYAQQRDYGAAKEKVGDWDALMQGVFAAAQVTTEAQLLVNLGLVHRDSEWQPYWEGWVEWMRASGWRRFGWYVWDQGPGLPGDWNGRLAPSHEFIFHFNRAPRKPHKTVPSKHAGETLGGGGLRGADGTVHAKTGNGNAIQSHRIPDSVFRVMRHKGGLGAAGSHPAVFPVALVEAVLTAFSDPGDLIYEPFCGSGTQIVAAERAGRLCSAMELDPVYCDVAVRRWEMATGRKAMLAAI